MAMDNRNLQRIKVLLQDTEVQVRVRENIRKGGEEAKVTIGRAAELFDIKPSKLRELDHLLKPERSTGTETGQRQYSLTELKKLAIISELLREGCVTTEIPANIDNVWQEVAGSETHQEQEVEKREDTSLYLPINRRIEEARKNLFWRYFASHALRLSLSLICEDIPNSPAGLILPLNLGTNIVAVNSIKDLPKVGESLVGWLSQSRSSHTLLTSRPSFEYESDYSLLRLTEMKDDEPLQPPTGNTLIILNRQDRRSAYLTLNTSAVETIRRLLAPLYENAQTMRECFGPGMYDVLDASTLIDSRTQDLILTGLADMIVHLGGHLPDGADRWRFCCILLPKDLMLPLHQSSLIIRAQSRNAPYKVGHTTVSPEKNTNSLSIKALQSGHIVYLPRILPSETSIAYRELEGHIQSALASPIGGEDGLPVAVLYAISDERDGFSEDEQRVLRILCKMIEEVLKTYRVRHQVAHGLSDIIAKPSLVDSFFQEFFSESDFRQHVEELLHDSHLNARRSYEREKAQQAIEKQRLYSDAEILSGVDNVVSFISVDIDKQSSLANKYGDRVTRNLSREVGTYIFEQLHAYTKEHIQCQLYHISADRFYILLKGVALERARKIAEQLRLGLAHPYKLDALRVSVDQPMRPESMLELPDITVRLGVTSYPYSKLEEVLRRYPSESAIAEVRSIITSALEMPLEMGKNDGGNVVFAWDSASRSFTRWSPPKQS